MWTAIQIRRFINGLPAGKLFTTRDLPSYGKRSAVDQALFLLVRGQRIMRVARGVFVKPGLERLRPISACEIAEVKAKAFKRQIISHSADAACELGLVDQTNREPTYATSGRSSSFRFGNTVIHLKGVSPRKMELGESQVGLIIRSLWHLGRQYLELPTMETLKSKLGRRERLQLRLSGAEMPSWLSEHLLFSKPLNLVPLSVNSAP